MRNLVAWIFAATSFVALAQARSPDLPHIIFFKSGTIQPWTSAGQDRVLEEFMSTYKRVGGHQVRVVGHTDTAETNVALSMARAEAVKSRLVELGVSDGRIAVVGLGDAHLLVVTPPGTDEPQNRRVEIEMR